MSGEIKEVSSNRSSGKGHPPCLPGAGFQVTDVADGDCRMCCALRSWWRPDFTAEYLCPLLIRLIGWCQVEAVVPFWSRDSSPWNGKNLGLQKPLFWQVDFTLFCRQDKWKAYQVCSREVKKTHLKVRFLNHQAWERTVKKLWFQMFLVTCHVGKQVWYSQGWRPLVKVLGQLNFWWSEENSGQILFVLTLDIRCILKQRTGFKCTKVL